MKKVYTHSPRPVLQKQTLSLVPSTTHHCLQDKDSAGHCAPTACNLPAIQCQRLTTHSITCLRSALHIPSVQAGRRGKWGTHRSVQQQAPPKDTGGLQEAAQLPGGTETRALKRNCMPHCCSHFCSNLELNDLPEDHKQQQ